MLELKVDDGERMVVLRFEHSLLSLSKWEAKHKKPFLSSRTKTPAELLEYFQDMLMSPDVDRDLVFALEPGQIDELAQYINDPRTASSVPQEETKKFQVEVVTSELIYYWLVGLTIPFHPVETWHLNRLMMLVQIANYKQQPEKKKSVRETMTRWREANERQKKMFNTSG